MKIAKLVSRTVVSPKFRHDCTSCEFLGRLNGEDLYRCQNTGDFSRRFGNSAEENGSLGVWTPEGSPYALAQALVARNLPPREYRA